MREYLEKHGWEYDVFPGRTDWYHIEYMGIVVVETHNEFILYIENTPFAYDLTPKQLAAIINAIYHFK